MGTLLTTSNMSPLDRHINKLINYEMMSVISARIHPPDMITCRYFHTYIRYQINQSFYEGRLGLSLMDSYYCIQIVRVY